MIRATLIQQLINGLALGCVYALIALGYTLIFGVMRLIFFAQGELCMVGAFAALGTVTVLKNHFYFPSIVVFLVAILVAIAVTVLAGVLSERLAIRPLRRAERTKQLIASLGVSLVLQNIVLLKVGAENFSFPALFPEDLFWIVGGARISPVQIFIISCSLILMLALNLILRATRIGLHLRAVSEDSDNAELDGVNVDRTILFTFIIGSVLACFAGVMMGSYDGVAKYNMGFLPGIKGFTAAVLGGFGQPVGAMVGGLVLGLSETMAAGYISSTYKDLIAFALLVLILIIRPRGLVGKRSWSA